ncbi:uncharacterized protein [Apostichopus japonicus]|uniref:uncharacterized protein n=1 Tax=Stichopus japonicus TaxID=307972 RepID=UPI003AB75F88
MTELKKSLPADRKSHEEVQTSFPSIKDRIRRLEGITKPNENYQETINEGVAAAFREEISPTKVVTNLKKVEEMNTKLEGEVTELKERLLVEEKTTKEMQTSSLKLNEKIKDLEDMKTELESQQKKLKDTLDQEKDKVTRAEGSRIQVRKDSKPTNVYSVQCNLFPLV